MDRVAVARSDVRVVRYLYSWVSIGARDFLSRFSLPCDIALFVATIIIMRMKEMDTNIKLIVVCVIRRKFFL